MSAIKTKRGLNLPISGGLSSHEVVAGPPIKQVAILPQEAVGIKPRLLVEVGDAVQIGTPLVLDKRSEKVLFTAPTSGEIAAIHRGARRALLAIVIQPDGANTQIDGFGPLDPAQTATEDLVDALCRSGLWAGLRRRPFECVARPDDEPRALFVTAIDTRPLAADPRELIRGREEHFTAGLTALARLAPKTFLCTGGGDWNSLAPSGVQVQEFQGPHLAGNVGTHMHLLSPVAAGRNAWHIGAQDVADIGEFLSTGVIPTERVVALVGPALRQPQLVRTQKGAAISELCAGLAETEEARYINGSVLDGKLAQPGDEVGYLGRYANQISVLSDAPKRRFLDWMNPFSKTHTVTNTVFSKFVTKEYAYDTDTNGSHRAIVPIGSYEEVMPLDILPTQLLRALVSQDLEGCEKLGVLELAEEDLSLCEYVCASKTDYSVLLRDMLTTIEKEG